MVGALLPATFIATAVWIITGSTEHVQRIPSTFDEWFDLFHHAAEFELFGVIISSPALFAFYLPWSITEWDRPKPQLLRFLGVGTTLGTLNGLIFGLMISGAHPFGAEALRGQLLFMPLFAGASFTTALFHWLLLKLLTRKHPPDGETR